MLSGLKWGFHYHTNYRFPKSRPDKRLTLPKGYSATYDKMGKIRYRPWKGLKEALWGNHRHSWPEELAMVRYMMRKKKCSVSR